MTTVPVSLGDRSYRIDIGPGLLQEAADRLLSTGRPSSCLVVTDEHVVEYAARVCDQLELAGVTAAREVVPAGEPSKSVDQAQRLWQACLDRTLDRHALIVAVGGGVVGDLAGFVAATFARGIGWFQIPTSLLAQVDSSVGGKVGINLPAAKNCIGAFWQPRGVLVDLEVLATLPAREYVSGLAEVVKYGVIQDSELFKQLEDQSGGLRGRDPEVLEPVIAACCRCKAEIVAEDEQETSGRRAVLNYGHTFAHAFESVSGYGRLLHGEAVAIGMRCAADLAARMGRIGEGVVERQDALLTRLDLPLTCEELPADRLLEAMRSDKKAVSGRLRFVLPDRLGHADLVDDVPETLVREVLRDAGAAD